MHFDEMIDQLAVDLNDAAQGHPFTVWSREQLRYYLKEGMNIAYEYRPDLFFEERTLKVEACNILYGPCLCTRIHAVLGQSDKDGNIIRPLKQRSNPNVQQTWRGRTCFSRNPNFILKEYYLDDVAGRLWLFPQVPVGDDVYVTVICSDRPEVGDDYDVATPFQAAIMQWALYRAKMVDAENNQATASMAAQHKQAFHELLAQQAQQVDKKHAERVSESARQQNNV